MKARAAKIVLTPIFLRRTDYTAFMPKFDQVNENTAKLAHGKHNRFLSVNERLEDNDG